MITKLIWVLSWSYATFEYEVGSRFWHWPSSHVCFVITLLCSWEMLCLFFLWMTLGLWLLEWVICNFFWYLCCFRQGFMRVTLRNKNNIGLICFMLVSSGDFGLLCCTITHYNYKGKMPRISPKIHKIETWPKSRPKVINSPNKSHRDHIWGMFEL